eukprot:scaffold222116_cov46-Prasinocladus_malaysianus.AAC.1
MDGLKWMKPAGYVSVCMFLFCSSPYAGNTRAVNMMARLKADVEYDTEARRNATPALLKVQSPPSVIHTHIYTPVQCLLSSAPSFSLMRLCACKD